MKAYRTVTDVKKHLPEILQRIEDCKAMDDCAMMMLNGIQRWCIDECTHPESDHGWWTTQEAYNETFKNHMQYTAEIEYLQGLIAKLPDYKDQLV